MCTLNAYNRDTFLQVYNRNNSTIPFIRPLYIIIEGYIYKSNRAAVTKIVIIGPVELSNSKAHNI